MVQESTIVPENKRLVVAVCYIFPLLGGIILFLIAENNRALKFHAFQSIVLGAIIWILGFVSPATICLSGLHGLVLWLYCLFGAYSVYTRGDWQSFVAGFVHDSLMK